MQGILYLVYVVIEELIPEMSEGEHLSRDPGSIPGASRAYRIHEGERTSCCLLFDFLACFK